MKLTDLLADEKLRQAEFPVTREKTFLAHAGVCPLPHRVAEAVSAYAREAAMGDQEKFVYPGVLEKARKLGATLLHCQSEEVALVGPTSLALSFLASGLKFKKGDNILIYHDDYPSNVYPWMALAERNVEVRMLNARELGQIRARDVMGQVDENTRLVALASCHFISGYRIDYQAIGKSLRERNVLFCLDGIQTLGAFPTTVEYVDMLAADAHKWMLGPCGAGLMYVRREIQPILTPPVYGWHNILCPNYVAQKEIKFYTDARKYEAGTHNLIGVIGMVAAMELLLEIGVDSISQELLRKRNWLVPALQAKGYMVLHAEAPAENAGAIISFFKPGEDLSLLHQRLTDAKVFTSLRVDRQGQRYIRLSPHFYNTDEELQRVVKNL